MEPVWTAVKGKTNSVNATKKHNLSFYCHLSNLYSTLPQYAADPPNTTSSQHNVPAASQGAPVPSTYKHKAQCKYLARQQKRIVQAKEEDCVDHHIQWAEDELTSLAKASQSKGRLAIDASHNKIKAPSTSILHNGRMAVYAFATTTKRICQRFHTAQHVQFHKQHSTRLFSTDDIPAITYDSGADGHYLNEVDRRRARLPILCPSTKQVAVANSQVSTTKHESSLPFEGLSQRANKADTFDDFPQSLMSVGKVSDDGTISVFTKDGVTVHREEDVLITCKGAPIFIGVRDHNGRYRVPLIQNKGQWQPRIPTKKARQHFEQANSVYDLPSTEQAVKWMHAVCGYPVKSTWLKAIKAGNFMGWPLLTEQNVKKYYPETTATPKGHLNQSRKNVRSTKTKPFEEPTTSQLRGRKNKDVYIKVYDVRETVFTDQTGQFPTRSQSGNKYIMVMVDIDSSGILVEPIKNRKDAELTRAYETLLQRLKRAGIEPKKHVLDNEISSAMKDLIKIKYKMDYELVPPGCHHRNAAEVAIRNFKAHFLSILAGVADDFPLHLWDRLLPQAEITINLLRQSNTTPTISAYAHLNGPFDCNKMPLAPMGCNVQVHEKSDAQGTWAFHSVDGWYISTSPEHYRTHWCHIKATNSERFSDTVEFQHKHITNPTIKPADKIMKAIASCIETIQGIPAFKANSDLQQLHAVLRESTTNPNTLERLIQHSKQQSKISPPRVNQPTTPLPRVDPELQDNQRITRAAAKQLMLANLPVIARTHTHATVCKKKRWLHSQQQALQHQL